MKFLKKDRNKRYAAYILRKLTGQYKHGLIAEIRKNGSFIDKIETVIEYLVEESAMRKKRYTASILPTIITPEQAPNFWFKNEKEPTGNEIYKFLFLLLTGLYQGNYVINLDNVDLSLMRSFRDQLIDRGPVSYTHLTLPTN